MTQGPAVRRRIGSWRWTIRPEDAPLLDEIGARGFDDWFAADASPIQRAPNRSSHAHSCGTTGVKYFVKIYRYRGFRRLLRYLYRRCPAEKEWRQGIEAARRGMRIAPGVALGQRRRGLFKTEGCVVARFIPGVAAPDAILRDPAAMAAFGGREPFLRAFGRTFGREARRLHDLGIIHREMKPGNLSVEREGAAVAILFLDAKHLTLRAGPAAERERAWNLARTAAFWRRAIREQSIHPGHLLRFLRAYTDPWQRRDARAFRNRVAALLPEAEFG